MSAFEVAFNERLSEIDSYLDLIAAFEDQVRTGPPRVGVDGPVVSALQQRILYSSVYLQLYNLIEATITRCIEGVCDAITTGDQWHPADLTMNFRREWVRYIARTHTDLNYENRLQSSLNMCDHLVQTLPVGKLEIEKGGGGNWDDEEIFRLAERLGVSLQISAESNAAVKRPFRNDKGALSLIVKLRNDLAHGNISFGECGAGITVGELRDLKNTTAAYLTEVVAQFKAFIGTHQFLTPHVRPTGEVTATA
jgi:hypothetical protein